MTAPSAALLVGALAALLLAERDLSQVVVEVVEGLETADMIRAAASLPLCSCGLSAYRCAGSLSGSTNHAIEQINGTKFAILSPPPKGQRQPVRRGQEARGNEKVSVFQAGAMRKVATHSAPSILKKPEEDVRSASLPSGQ